jgi:hypothetical protein
MILAGNGNYALAVFAGGRKDANSPGAAASFGTWSVNETDKTLTLHRVGNLDPTLEGKDLKLNISLNGEELKYTGDAKTADGKDVHLEGTMRRFKQ